MLDLERHVPALLSFLANEYTNGQSSFYRKAFGVSVIDWRCMALLAVEPWSSPTRISQVVGVDKAAISRSVRLLERKGLVEIRSSSQRSRFLEIALTPQGRKLHDRIIRVALEREKRLLADIGPPERELLIRLLNRMLRSMPTVNGPIDIPPETDAPR